MSTPPDPLTQTPEEPALEGPQQPEPFPVWSGSDVLIVATVTVVLGFFIFPLIALVVAQFSPAFHGRPITDLSNVAVLIVPAQAAAYLCVLALMYRLVAVHHHTPFWRAIRWNWPGQHAIGYLALGLALAILVQSASNFLPIPKQLPIDKFFSSRAAVWMLLLFGVTLAPLMEELFFRGLLYPVLERWFRSVLESRFRTRLAISLSVTCAVGGVLLYLVPFTYRRFIPVVPFVLLLFVLVAYGIVRRQFLLATALFSAGLFATSLFALHPTTVEIWFGMLVVLAFTFAMRGAVEMRSVALAATYTALSFALIHGAQLANAWAPLMLLFCVGLALTWIRIKADSVAASLLIHVAYNSTLFFMLWLATDHFTHLEKLQH